jgi:hypothetical protein
MTAIISYGGRKRLSKSELVQRLRTVELGHLCLPDDTRSTVISNLSRRSLSSSGDGTLSISLKVSGSQYGISVVGKSKLQNVRVCRKVPITGINGSITLKPGQGAVEMVHLADSQKPSGRLGRAASLTGSIEAFWALNGCCYMS